MGVMKMSEQSNGGDAPVGWEVVRLLADYVERLGGKPTELRKPQ